MSQSLVDALQDPALYDHPVSQFEVIETHISWVLLTGDYVYKIKKPVDFGFLDFSTLEKRHHFCREELRLNQRLAPELYLDVIAIGGSVDAPVLGDKSSSIEYAVKMRQFDEASRLDHLLTEGKLTESHIDQLADELATFHQSTAVADKTKPYGDPEIVYHFIDENFQQIRPLLDPAKHQNQLELLDVIEQWCRQSFDSLRDVILKRKQNGFVRECHGDAHLANMVLIENNVVLFDCLEFNPELRWIDVISELAFVTMDLDDRKHPEFSRRLRDRYLQRTGDYAGLALLRFYQVYRACVRAKVAALRLQQTGSSEERESTWQEFCSYLELAGSYTHAQHPVIICCYGVSGSGKTTVSQKILESLPLIRLRSDVERKRLFGLTLEAKTPVDKKAALYGKDATRRTFERLAEIARLVVSAGFGVIVDATFLRQTERERFSNLANTLGKPFVILEVIASEKVMRSRIEHRDSLGEDASEADTSILELQLEWREALTEEEREHTLTVTNDDGFDLGEICTNLDTLIKSR